MAMTKVSEVIVGAGGAASIEFTNIPQTGKDLLVLYSLRTVDNIVYSFIRIQLNGDSGANYSFRRLQGNGSSASSSSGGGQGGLTSYATGANATSSIFGNNSLYISNYTSSVAKSASIDSVTENNATEAYQTLWANSWTGTSAITSLKIIENSSGTIAQHSTASLYIIS